MKLKVNLVLVTFNFSSSKMLQHQSSNMLLSNHRTAASSFVKFFSQRRFFNLSRKQVSHVLFMTLRYGSKVFNPLVFGKTISDMLPFFEFYSLFQYKDFHFYKMSPALISKTPSVDPCIFGMICFSCKIGVYAFLRIFRNC